MSEKKLSVNLNWGLPGPVDLVIRIASAMVGYTIHQSVFWSVIDFLFWPIAWIKWLVCHEVNWTIIKETFSFLVT